MNDQDWKQKYLNYLDKQEAREKRSEALETLLRQGLSRVALAAQGLDSQLDDDLTHLRKVIRGDLVESQLEAVINDLSRSVTRLDEARSAKPKTSRPQDLLLQWLDSLSLPRDLKKPVKKLRSRIQNCDQATELDAPLRELAKVLSEYLAGIQASTNHQPGFLARLFSPGTETPPAAQPTPIANAVENVSEIGVNQQHRHNTSATANEPHIAAPQPTTVATATSSPAPDPRNATQLGEFCIQLLDTLSLPASLDTQAQDLKDRLADGIEAAAIPPTLNAIAGLVSTMRGQMENENRELQDFLHQLTGHLQDIDQHLAGTKNQHQASVNRGRTLDAAVTAQVTEIETSVEEVTEPDRLKQQIQTRLNAIREHLEQYRHSESQHQSELEDRLKRLDEKIHTMETESDQLRENLREKQSLAMRDPLTGLNNRLAYDERIAQELARAKRYNTPLVLMVIDIDHFKSVNDTYGHRAGDKALMLIAGQLKNNLRETDFLARFGGEEFVLIMPETDLESAAVAAEKLRGAVESCQFHYQGTSVGITISSGLAQLKDGDNHEALFHRADRAMYQAKKAGRNRCISDPD